MSAPVWYTKANNLGVIQEGKFYQFALDARDPEGGEIVYSVVAGSLPDGIELSSAGSLFGNPKKVIQGVPFEVSQDEASRFTVRATSEDFIVADRTFSLTVTGQDIPVFSSPTFLGSWIDYQYINEQIIVTDSDSTDVVTYELLSGDLPLGTELTADGYIRGFIEPNLVQGEASSGDFDAAPFDTVLWDSGAGTSSYSKLYNFIVRATDSKAYVVKEFSIYVYGGFDLKCDSTDITADHVGTVTADMSSAYSPVIKHDTSDLGSYLHDNRFNFQVIAEDYSNDDIEYSISAGALPPGLTIDSTTGWIHGTLPFINQLQQEYTFTVKVQKVADPDNIYYDTHQFQLTLKSNRELEISWTTDNDLGTIRAGDISTLNVNAYASSGVSLTYEILEESNSKLPQGLILQPNGDLQGQVSFKSFQLDAGTTTFDEDTTTVDGTCVFTVRAIDSSRSLYADRTFTLRVINEYNRPYENLYIELLPKLEDRFVWEDMVYNNTDIPNNLLYRPTDIYFGRQSKARMLFLPGMEPTTLEEYARAVYRNHYTITLKFGEFNYARVLDENDNHIYDVVYVDIIDSNEPEEGLIANTYIEYDTINNPITVDESAHIDNGTITVDNNNVGTLYPARLSSMRSRIENIIGRSDSRQLPKWMSSVQEDGSVIGYTPACVIAYVQPGEGKRIKYYLDINNDIDLNEIEFTVDRYTLDSFFSQNYDKENNEWITRDETTFDRLNKLEASGDGSTVQFELDHVVLHPASVYVLVNGSELDDSEYTVVSNLVTLSSAPAEGASIIISDENFDTLGNVTTFDGGTTRFFAYSDKPRVELRDGGDYIKFPRTTITDLP
jgi:hypothetical protein